MTRPPKYLESKQLLTTASGFSTPASTWTWNANTMTPFVPTDHFPPQGNQVTPIEVFGEGYERGAAIAGRLSDVSAYVAGNPTRAALNARLSGNAALNVNDTLETVQMSYRPVGLFDCRYYIPGSVSLSVTLEKSGT